MARFYSNENIALPMVVALRGLGHDVLTSLEAGRANASVPDSEVLAFATSQMRSLLSHNRLYFLRLHRQVEGRHAGIVLCTFDSDFAGQANRIHSAVAVGGDLSGQVIRVNRPD